MAKIIHIKLEYDNGVVECFDKGILCSWLLIIQGFDYVISLSGNDEKNAFLLKMLDTFVTNEINRTNRVL